MSNQYGCYSIEWTRELNIQIMEELRKRKSLWDVCSSEYKDKFRKQKDYQELATMFSVPPSEVEKKIHNLKSQFRREFRRSKLRSSSSPYKSKWYGFRFMKFLKEGDTYNSSKVSKKNKKSNSSTGSVSETITTDLPSSTVPASPNKVSTSLERQLDNRDAFEKSKDMFYKIIKAKENEHKLTRDEYTVFGEYVTHELKKISNPYILTVTKHKIQEALFEGHMSMFSSACDFTENEYSYISQNTEDCQNTPSSIYSFSSNLSPTPSPPLLEQNEIQ